MNPLLSQTVKNFIAQFETNVLPHINKGENLDEWSTSQPVTCYVSATTLLDPQLRELVGIKPGTPEGLFMNVRVVGKPDMTTEIWYEPKNV
jgi:hypothetical protein